MDTAIILNSLSASWSRISPLILNLILGLALLLVGFLAAKGVGWLTSFILKLLQLDRLAKVVGFNRLLEKGEVKRTASELLGDLIYWIIVFVVVISAANLFGLPVEPVLSTVLNYIGIVFLAALVLGIGAFLATLISGIIFALLANFGIVGAKTISRVIYYVVIIFAFLVALAEFGISLKAFEAQIGVIIGAVGLAAAIAFGLGCKDMAADFLHNLFKGK